MRQEIQVPNDFPCDLQIDGENEKEYRTAPKLSQHCPALSLMENLVFLRPNILRTGGFIYSMCSASFSPFSFLFQTKKLMML